MGRHRTLYWCLGACGAQYAAWLFRGYAELKCCVPADVAASRPMAAVNFPFSVALMMSSLAVLINFGWLYLVVRESISRRGGDVASAGAVAWRQLCLFSLFIVLPLMPLIYIHPGASRGAMLWALYLAPGLFGQLSFLVLPNFRP